MSANYINHIALVLDESSSMSGRANELIRVADGEIAHLAQRGVTACCPPPPHQPGRQVMRRIKSMLLASVVAIASMLVLAPAPANASTTLPGGCGSSRVCLFVDINGGGSHYDIISTNICVWLPISYNDVMSSYVNNTNYRVEVYQHANCSGFSDFLPANSYGAHRHSMSSCCLMNDVVSAVYIGSGAP